MKISLFFLAFAPLSTQTMHREAILSYAHALPSQAKQLISLYPKTTGAIVATVALGSAWYYSNDYERREDASNNKLDVSKFPKNFKIGAATSCTQLSGVETVNDQEVENNWTEWEKDEIIPCDNRALWKKLFALDKPDLAAIPRIAPENRMGRATGHWNRYDEDYGLAQDFGLDGLRISLEWSKIQPTGPDLNDINHDVIEHYINQVKSLKKRGMHVTLCLYHHVLPTWFADNGGFEKAENIEKFVQTATLVLQKINDACSLDENDKLITFNEPAGYALAAYIYGKYPPGKKFKFKECGIVLKNMLDAHCALYKSFKEINSKVPISIAHMMHPLHPYNPWNPLDTVPAKIFDHLLNTVTLEYLSTGKFKWLWYINETNEDAKNKLDFVGVNYYTHTLLGMFKPRVRPFEITGDSNEGENGKALYPEGLYDSLHKAHSYFPDKSIYITELGLATSDCKKAKLFVEQSFYQIEKAIADGITIEGLDWWTLLNDYGWNSGNNNNYGLYAVDYNDNCKRSLKPSSKYLQKIIAQLKQTH